MKVHERIHKHPGNSTVFRDLSPNAALLYSLAELQWSCWCEVISATPAGQLQAVSVPRAQPGPLSPVPKFSLSPTTRDESSPHCHASKPPQKHSAQAEQPNASDCLHSQHGCVPTTTPPDQPTSSPASQHAAAAATCHAAAPWEPAPHTGPVCLTLAHHAASKSLYLGSGHLWRAGGGAVYQVKMRGVFVLLKWRENYGHLADLHLQNMIYKWHIVRITIPGLDNASFWITGFFSQIYQLGVPLLVASLFLVSISLVKTCARMPCVSWILLKQSQSVISF